jgi:serine/threonine protein kinase
MSRGWSTEISRGYASESQGHPISLMEIVKTNVLIDGAKQARLADFGLLAMVSDTTNLLSSTSFTQGGTPQWMSPELLDPKGFGLKDGRPTEHSDCYALGMLIYEVLSGRTPFSQQCGHPIALILKGERPERPQEVCGAWFTNEIWGMLEHCWKPSPGDRPGVGDVLQYLEDASRSWIPSSCQTVVGPSAPDPPARTFDLRAEESTDESEIYSPPQGVSSHPPRKHSKGNPNKNCF